MTDISFGDPEWVARLDNMLNGRPPDIADDTERPDDGEQEAEDGGRRRPTIPVDYAAAYPPPPAHAMHAFDSLGQSFMRAVRGY